MDLVIDKEFRKICSEIISEHKTEDEWAAIESDDMFQTTNYCGGYDTTEMAFCFSYYNKKENEFWFQLTLAEINEVSNGAIQKIGIRPAE